MTLDLFEHARRDLPDRQELCPGASVLRNFATRDDAVILAALHVIASAAPFRHMTTPGGLRMSVAMTNCGSYGWVTDLTGYRYDALDPQNGRPWPAIPDTFSQLARQAAADAGFASFAPDSCLINRYEPGTKLSLHQDRDEKDFRQPIVSVSLGVPALFLFGGLRRNDPLMRVPLAHGDVVVWGGPARLRYHGVSPLKEAHHPALGRYRVNLTFRKAG